MADESKKKPSKSKALPKASRAVGNKSGANPSSGARSASRPPPPRPAGR